MVLALRRKSEVEEFRETVLRALQLVLGVKVLRTLP